METNQSLKFLAQDFMTGFAPEGLEYIDRLFEHLKFETAGKLEDNFALAMPPEMRRKILSDIGIQNSDSPEISQRYLPHLIIINKLFNKHEGKLSQIGREEIAGFIWKEGRRLKLFEYEIQKLIDIIPNWINRVAQKCFVEFTPANICEVENNEKSLTSEQISFNGIIGRSQKMISMFNCLKKIGKSNLSILIQGESGTGKELVAHAVHSISDRSAKNFIPVNCGALPDSIIESELFGYEKGAFTGASYQKKGYFEIAGDGTIFLDEISETSLNTQVKLLRVLQEKQFYRVGGTQPVKIDARVIAATNRNLLEHVKNGSFRHDLYYRINEMTITLPPLRERKVDLPLLTKHFIKTFAKQNAKPTPKLSDKADQLIKKYNWPGNIRELENALKRAVVLAEDVIEPCHFPAIIRDFEIINPQFVDELDKNSPGSLEAKLNRAEKMIILKALAENDNNVSKTAQELEISRRTLQRKIKHHQIDK
jgi:transcriptional regulator with PAS, ATPase and Fis domain